MTYSVYDQNGYVGDYTTISGYDALKDYLLAADPFFASLFDDGATEDLEGLTAALMSVKSAEDPDVQKSIDSLAAYAKKCVGVLIIADDSFVGNEELTATNAEGEIFSEETQGGTYQRTVKGINDAIGRLTDDLFKELDL